MTVLFGIVVLMLSLLCWIGQVVVTSAPAVGVRLGISEAEADVEPTFWADVRGEALWDSFTLWTLPVAGGLLIAGHDAWAYFGLVGGGMYLYFSGRGIATRVAMRRRGLRVGTDQNLRVGYTFLGVWGLVAVVTIVGAVATLSDT